MFDVGIYEKMRRGPQIVLLKDAALVTAFTGLQSGDRVVEAGSGSGFLTVHLASIVAPTGKIYSYERNAAFYQLAKENIEKAGMDRFVELKNKDVLNGIDENNIDLICLDMSNAEKVLENAFQSLKKGGIAVGYLPNIEQLNSFVSAGKKAGFEHINSIESIVRKILVKESGTRPESSGVLHTAYLSFLKKR